MITDKSLKFDIQSVKSYQHLRNHKSDIGKNIFNFQLSTINYQLNKSEHFQLSTFNFQFNKS